MAQLLIIPFFRTWTTTIWHVSVNYCLVLVCYGGLGVKEIRLNPVVINQYLFIHVKVVDQSKPFWMVRHQVNSVKPCLHQPYDRLAIACDWKRKEFARDRTAVVRIRNAVRSIATSQGGFRHVNFPCDIAAVRTTYELMTSGMDTCHSNVASV